MRQGCDVQPLIDGVPAFRRICEAIEAANTSVWGTVAFLEHGAPMPDGRGSIFDVLGAAAARGVDVRVVFWRSTQTGSDEHFPGDDRQQQWLADQRIEIKARWDALPESCVHQKSWLIDAGTDSEHAFVGGINLDHASTTSLPGHQANVAGNVHDVYLEVTGPAASDVHHNFVQRWNESSERHEHDGQWPPAAVVVADRGDLPFPATLSPVRGDVPVQISRTVQPGRYADMTPAPDAAPYRIADGEFSIYEQYISAIDAAEHVIYIEDQVVGSPKVVGHLHRALERGVVVLLVVPGECHPGFHQARHDEASAVFMSMFDALADNDAFTLAALSRFAEGGTYDEIYVHAKVMLVDDAWATIGSTNTATQSFRLDTEMNASFWHRDTVLALRVALFAEHLGVDTSALTASDAAHVFRERSRRNAIARTSGEQLDGLAYQLDPAAYGYENPKSWTRPSLL